MLIFCVLLTLWTDVPSPSWQDESGCGLVASLSECQQLHTRRTYAHLNKHILYILQTAHCLAGPIHLSVRGAVCWEGGCNLPIQTEQHAFSKVGPALHGGSARSTEPHGLNNSFRVCEPSLKVLEFQEFNQTCCSETLKVIESLPTPNVDIRYVSLILQRFNSFLYFHLRTALSVVLRGDVDKGWLAHFAMKCASWTNVNSGTSGRSACSSIGNTEYPSVKEGNCLASRSFAYIHISFLFVLCGQQVLVQYNLIWVNIAIL